MIKIWDPIQDLDKKVTAVNEIVRNLEYKFKNMDKNLNQEIESLKRNQTETMKCKPIKLENYKRMLHEQTKYKDEFQRKRQSQDNNTLRQHIFKC